MFAGRPEGGFSLAPASLLQSPGSPATHPEPVMWRRALLLGCLALLVVVEAKRKRVEKGRHPHRHKEAEVGGLAEDDPLGNELETPEELSLGLPDNTNYHDPCKKRHCGSGQTCRLTEDGEPTCICIPDCPQETDPRRKVCSNKNETWDSDCALNQMRCWCKEGDSRCTNAELSHAHIDYYGTCKLLEDCEESQMEDFPRRMRDWLFHVMRDMADREELSPYYYRMERDAETNLTRRWNAAAVWKWCDLDSTHDRTVSRHELFPIRAPLMAMEQCIAPFLNSCDANNDHLISLQEWTTCLQLNPDDIEDKCEDIRDDES